MEARIVAMELFKLDETLLNYLDNVLFNELFFRMCGHKYLETKLDGKPFGFPFDRKFSFRLKENQKYYQIEVDLKFI